MSWAFAFSEAVPCPASGLGASSVGINGRTIQLRFGKRLPPGLAQSVAPSLVLSRSQGLGRGLALAWPQGDLERAETQEQAGRRLEGPGLRAGMGSQSSGRAKGGGGGVRGDSSQGWVLSKH